MYLVRIKSGDLEMTAALNSSMTAAELRKFLPIKSKAQRWGQEVYFETHMQFEEENPQAAVPSGTIAYWPPGSAFCIFFGQTPYSPVNVVGKLQGDPELFDKVRSGDEIIVEKI